MGVACCYGNSILNARMDEMNCIQIVGHLRSIDYHKAEYVADVNSFEILIVIVSFHYSY